MRLALVDAGGANIGSVRYALQRLGIEPELTIDAAVIRAADRVILPGVSTAATVMQRLRALDLVETLRALRQPLLGVCVGMQLLFEHSEENDTPCLGLLPGQVRKLDSGAGVRVPHMGWSRLRLQSGDPLTAGFGSDEYAYFVHSYAAPVGDACIASADHGRPFAAIVRQGNVCGAQFHPERSAAAGERLLRNFLALEAA